MKSKIYLLPLLAAGSLLGACTNEDPDYFDKAAAYRIDDIKKETSAQLVDAPNGWELQYFANNTWEPGYTILMRFTDDHAVEMAANNAFAAFASGASVSAVDNNPALIYTDQMYSDISLWKMVSDAGPVITFDTFNNMLHPFAEPYDVPLTVGQNEAGNGHEGDYEFIVMDHSDPDLIMLRGKKTGIDMPLRKLPAGTDWAEYLGKITNTYRNTFSSLFPEQVLTFAGQRYIVSNAYSGLWDIYREGEDALTTTGTIVTMPLADGYRFRVPFDGDNYGDGNNKVEGEECQEMHFGDDGLLRASNALLEPLYNAAQMLELKTYKMAFSFVDGQSGGAAADMLQRFAAATKTKYKKNLKYLQLYYKTGIKVGTKTQSSFCLQFGATGATESTAPLVLGEAPVAADGNITFAYSLEEGNANGKNRLKDMPEFKELIEFLNAHPWKGSSVSASPYIPDTLRFEDPSNPASFFTLTVAKNK